MRRSRKCPLCLTTWQTGFLFPLVFHLYLSPDHRFRTRLRRTVALGPWETFRGQGNRGRIFPEKLTQDSRPEPTAISFKKSLVITPPPAILANHGIRFYNCKDD